MIVTTNNHPRQFVNRCEVPAKVLADQFDYQDPETVCDMFFKYRGTWYHVDQFMRLPGDHEYDGVCSECAWTGVLLKFVECYGEQEFILASYRS